MFQIQFFMVSLVHITLVRSIKYVLFAAVPDYRDSSFSRPNQVGEMIAPDTVGLLELVGAMTWTEMVFRFCHLLTFVR